MKRKAPRWVIGIIGGLSICIIGLVAYGAYQYNSIFPKIYEPLTESNQGNEGKSVQPIGGSVENSKEQTEEDMDDNAATPFTMLILGVDSRGEKSSRSDTIIVSVVNPQSKKITLLSIPRDTRVKLPGKGYEKLNHTMFLGGVPMVKEAMEEFIGLPIQRYVTIDFEGFRRTIDELGGIPIDVKKRMKYYDPADGTDIDLQPGLQTLNGKEALDYARYRKSDIARDDTDFERIARQQEVIRAVADKAKNFTSIFKIFSFMDIVGDHMKTDLHRNEIEDLVKQFRDFSSEGIETISLAGEDKYLPYGEYTLYFYVVSDEERERIKAELETALNETGETESTEIQQAESQHVE